MAKTMKVNKAQKNEKRELMKMLTVDALVGFFTKQAKAAGKKAVTEGPTQKQMKRYAKACRKSLEKVLFECSTVESFSELSRNLLVRLDPKGNDYLNALAY